MSERTVLYVEDNYHNRRLVRKILESRGYHVLEAEDGVSGLALIRAERPPLVLMDISLPDMDGLQVVAAMRADAALAAIPVIALTASAMRGDRERFLEAGCDDYLSKPVQAMELVERVDGLYPVASGQDVAP
jgi:two-component system cell cycle response regulator DivK